MKELSRDNRLVALALFLWACGEGLFMYIQPIYIQQLGADPVQVGGVLSLSGLALALAFLPGGLISDRVPRKAVMLAGWGLGLGAVLVMASAGSWRAFIPGIVLYSFSAFCIPAVNATIVDSAGDLPMEHVLTLVYAAYSGGSILSPSVGGWLAGRLGMRAVYFIAAGCFSVSALTLLQLVHRPSPARARLQAAQLPSAHILRSSALVALLIFLTFLAMYIGQPLAPNFLRNIAGWPVERIGLLGSLNALGITVLAPALGRWSGAGSDKQRGVWAAQALMWLSLALLLIGARLMPALVLVAFFMRGGYSTCRSLMSAYIAGSVASENRGAAFGLSETAVASAQMAGPYLAGLLYEIRPTAPIWVGLISIPVIMLLVPAFYRRASLMGRLSPAARCESTTSFGGAP